MIEAALAAELERVRKEQRALYTRAAHVKQALTMARLGTDEGIVRSVLEAKGIVVLVRPAVPAGSAT